MQFQIYQKKEKEICNFKPENTLFQCPELHVRYKTLNLR